MSNELLNAHIKLGEPCGEDADFAWCFDNDLIADKIRNNKAV